MRKAVNFIAFQAAWFAAVLGAANGMPRLGVVAVPIALGLHLALSPDWRPELLLAFCAAGMGFATDTMLIAAGAFSPIPYLFPAPYSSLWMVMLWVNLSATMNVSMSWLHGRYALGGVFGGIGGPMAYYSGAKLGAMTRLPEPGGLLWIGIAWALALPLLYGIVGIESRGFIFGAALASRMRKAFVPARKPGKLPYDTHRVEYELEYGSDAIEIHKDAVSKGEKVLIVDDLIATGGTAEAACKLIDKMGGKIVECCFVIDLPDIGGRARLEKHGHKVFALCEFEGD